jgi:hypothetical protein
MVLLNKLEIDAINVIAANAMAFKREHVAHMMNNGGATLVAEHINRLGMVIEKMMSERALLVGELKKGNL